MSMITVRISQDLINMADEILTSELGYPSNLSRTSIVSKCLSLFLYGVDNVDDPHKLVKQKLEGSGATPADYTKGKVRTWARLSEQMKEDGTGVSPKSKLEDTINSVLHEQYKDDNSDKYRISDRVYLDPSERKEVEAPNPTLQEPPWKSMKLIDWNKILGLYPARNKNPLVGWAGDNTIKCYSVQAALAYMPPTEWTSPEALRLSRELYERFRLWATDEYVEPDEDT